TTPGTRSIWNSTGRVGGIPGKSLGKNSGKSLTIGTSSSRLPSDLSLASFVVTFAKKTSHPFDKYSCALVHEMIFNRDSSLWLSPLP
nr:hypothetical protein [Tanacetum cinerariifolium]